MKLPERLLDALLHEVLPYGRTSHLEPYNHLAGYMNRWWVDKPGVVGGKLGVDEACRVHQILRSDQDRDRHDHPWDYTSIILANGYWEVTAVEDPGKDLLQDPMNDYFIVTEGPVYKMERALWYGPGSILQRKATDAHRLILPEGKDCWTLFMTGPYQQGWGFLTPSGKVPWREYLGLEAANEYASTNPFNRV